jgi:hypothetical protein
MNSATMKRLEQERRKLRNLVSALEEGASSPAAVLKAIGERDKVIGELEAQVRTAAEVRAPRKLDVSTDWIEQQLSDLAVLLKDMSHA